MGGIAQGARDGGVHMYRMSRCHGWQGATNVRMYGMSQGAVETMLPVISTNGRDLKRLEYKISPVGRDDMYL